jgi:DNA-binding MarR family transcriptional regulator
MRSTNAMSRSYRGARLTDAMRLALTERGLTASRAEVIYLLAREGTLVQRELAHALGCSPRHVTGLIDTLQHDGLVERRPHPPTVAPSRSC